MMVPTTPHIIFNYSLTKKPSRRSKQIPSLLLGGSARMKNSLLGPKCSQERRVSGTSKRTVSSVGFRSTFGRRNLVIGCSATRQLRKRKWLPWRGSRRDSTRGPRRERG